MYRRDDSSSWRKRRCWFKSCWSVNVGKSALALYAYTAKMMNKIVMMAMVSAIFGMSNIDQYSRLLSMIPSLCRGLVVAVRKTSFGSRWNGVQKGYGQAVQNGNVRTVTPVRANNVQGGCLLLLWIRFGNDSCTFGMFAGRNQFAR